MIRLSNHGTLLNKSMGYFGNCILIGMIILTNYLMWYDWSYLGLLYISPLTLILCAGLVINTEFNSKLYEAFVDENYLYIRSYFKSDKVDLSKIVKVRYYRLQFIWFFERRFSVRFKEKTKFGNKIYIYPSNLDPEKKIKFDLNRKGLLEEMINKNRA